MGLIGAAFGLGFVFGPLIGGFLSHYGYEVAGYASAGFSFAACAFAAFILPESHKAVKQDEEKKPSYKLIDFEDFKVAFSYPTVGILILLFFIIIFSIANIYGTFALLGYKIYGFTDAQNGYQFALVGIVSAVIQGGLIKKLSEKFSDGFLVASGTLLMVIGLGFMPYSINFYGVAVTVIILSMGTGVLQPTILSMISKYAPEDKQGTILGLNQSIGALARVLGPLWGGFAFDFIGYEFPFLTGALFTFITFIVTIAYLNKKYFRTD
jgi:DHA1 family tetracycline resistance protein-like MFS transporter